MPKIFDTQTIIITGGGTPTPGNLRWGPNYGNNEQRTFGAAGSISVAEFRQVVLHDLFCVGELILKVDITALLPTFVQGMLEIFFTLVFLYTLSLEASISMPALALVGTTQVAGSIAMSPVLDLDTFVAGRITMPSLVEIGLTRVAGSVTGVLALDYENLIVQGSITQPALVLVGLTRVEGSITQPALQLVGLTRVNGLPVISTLQIQGLQLNVAGSVTGRLGLDFDNLIAGCAITQPALSEVGFLQVDGSPKITQLKLGDGTGTTGLGLEGRIAATSAGIGLTYELDFIQADDVNVDINFTIPAGVTSLLGEVWAGGGGGGNSNINGGGGGGGGGYARENARAVAAGDNIIVRVGSGGIPAANGQVSRVTHVATVIAEASGGATGVIGGAVNQGAGGAGGAGATGDVLRTGGNGGGGGAAQLNGGGGGGGAGTNANGGNGLSNMTAGAGGAELGGNGGTGAGLAADATNGSVRGGGGGGGRAGQATGSGARGGARLKFAA